MSMVSQPVEECPCCRRQGVLMDCPSLVDTTTFKGCTECFDHRAHPLHIVVRVSQQPGWRNLPDNIRNAMRIWRGEEGYITVPAWAKICLQQQVVMVGSETHQLITKERKRELEERIEQQSINHEAKLMIKRMKQVIDQPFIPTPKPRPQRNTLFSRLLGFGGWVT